MNRLYLFSFYARDHFLDKNYNISIALKAIARTAIPI